MTRRILSKTETSEKLAAFAAVMKEAGKLIDDAFRQSSGEMARRMEDGNHFDIDFRGAMQAAKKLAEQLADEAEVEMQAVVAPVLQAAE